jgi:hypothetical protein
VKNWFIPIVAGVAVLAATSRAADALTRADWGAPAVAVSHTGGNWIIAGKKQAVILDEKTLGLEVNAQSVVWKMPASSTNDMIAKKAGTEFPLRLADAKNISIEPPRWLPTLGKFGYLRTARMCFFETGNYGQIEPPLN